MAFVDIWSIPHFLLMFGGILLMLAGIVLTFIKKPKTKWFLLHKIFTASGLILTVVGILLLAGLTFTFNHPIIGIVSLILCASALVIGLVFQAVKKNKKNLRVVHIWVARVGILLMIIALIIGVLLYI